MDDTNPWLNIPLEDYERYMSHHLVGQATPLNTLTRKYLDTAFERFDHKITLLQLLNLDIAKYSETICRADFVLITGLFSS